MSGLIFHLIPHTHWDREWYLPRAAFQARLVPALDDVLERLTADPGYRSFLLDGQTVLVAAYLRARQERDLYRWRGPEGRDVLLWHLPPRGYELGAALPADADGLGAVWTGVRTALVERAAGKHVAVLIGADHHAAHPAVSRLRELLAE